MAKNPIKIPRVKGPTGPSNQEAARNRKKWKQQIAREHPLIDKKSGKRFKTVAAATAYGIQQKKAEKIAQAQRKTTIVAKLKEKTSNTR